MSDVNWLNSLGMGPASKFVVILLRASEQSAKKNP
jgi:hypothetical protein